MNNMGDDDMNKTFTFFKHFICVEQSRERDAVVVVSRSTTWFELRVEGRAIVLQWGLHECRHDARKCEPCALSCHQRQ